MAWFINRYHCTDCGASWEDAWSAMSDDDCPDCGARHICVESSEDVSLVLDAAEGGQFEVLLSSKRAEDSPDYVVLVSTPSRAIANAVFEAAKKMQGLHEDRV